MLVVWILSTRSIMILQICHKYSKRKRAPYASTATSACTSRTSADHHYDVMLYTAPYARILTSSGWVPTSITTAPGLSQLPRTKFGTPAAVTTMSASSVISSGFFVKACTTLTVAWCLCPIMLVSKHLWSGRRKKHKRSTIFWKITSEYLQQQESGQPYNVASPNNHGFSPHDLDTRSYQ